MISVTISDFLIGYVEMATKLKHFSTGTLHNPFWFNVLRQIMTIEWMHDNDLDQQGVRWWKLRISKPKSLNQTWKNLSI